MSSSLPTTQVAVQVTKYGNPSEVVTINTTAAVPSPTDKEVLINVKAVSVNPADLKAISGAMASFLKLPFPYTIGTDLAGVVVAVGSQVQRLKVGDAVYAAGPLNGSFAEYTAIAEERVALKPASLSFTEAAALPAVSLTSLQVLKRQTKGNIQPGDKVLVLGGSGGTGSIAIQLAKALGASETAATTSSRNVDFVKSLGATKAIPYDQQQWHEVLAGAEYDLVYDTQGSDPSAYQHSFKMLKKSGKFVAIAGAKQQSVIDGSAPTFLQSFVDLSSNEARQELDEVNRLVEAGRVKPVIEKVYELMDAVQMLETSAAGRVRGKLVLDIDAQKYKQQQQ